MSGKLANWMRALLESPWKAFALALALAALIFLPFLGRRHLWDSDEPRVAGIAAEMARSGDWTVPRLNGEPFLEIPPLHWWVSAACFKAFGESTATAKLPSALAALVSIACVFGMARAAGLSPAASFASAMILASSPEFWIVGRRCIMDMTMCACVALAILSFLKFAESEGGRRALWLAAFWIGLSGAALTKGIVGLGIPCSGIFVWMLARREKSVSTWAGLFGAAALSLAPAALWLVQLNEKAGWEAVRELAWTNNIGRFTGGHAEHVEPFFYYFEKFPAQFLPWTILAAATSALLWKSRLNAASKKAAAFSGICFAVPFAILCVAAGKRSIYLLPLYPAAALFAGASLDWLIEKAPSRKAALAALSAIFAAYACALLAVDALVMPASNGKKSYEPLYGKCAELLSSGGEMILYKPPERFRGGAAFYLKKRFPATSNPQELAAFLAESPKRFALADAEALDEIPHGKAIGKFQTGKKTWAALFRLEAGGKD